MMSFTMPRALRPSAVLPFLAAALLLVSLASPCAAGERWSLYGYGLLFEPTGDSIGLERTLPTAQFVEEGGTGFGAELEWRWNRRLSLATGIFFLDLDSDLRLGTGGTALEERQSFGVYAPYFGADWHLSPDSRTDVRLGAFVAQLNFEDIIYFDGTPNREILRYDDDFGFGLRLGVDHAWRKGGPWSLRAEVRYLVVLLESENAGEDLDLDPLLLTLGIAYRF
jgi:hypothetical protein